MDVSVPEFSGNHGVYDPAIRGCDPEIISYRGDAEVGWFAELPYAVSESIRCGLRESVFPFFCCWDSGWHGYYAA